MLVAAAICPNNTAGAELATPTKWCSAIQNRRYPHRSARWARSIVLCSAVAASLPALIGDRSRIDNGTVVTYPPPRTGWALSAGRAADAATRRRGTTSETDWPAAVTAPPRRRSPEGRWRSPPAATARHRCPAAANRAGGRPDRLGYR